MKPLIFSADNHLTSKKPMFRTDDYPITGLRKLKFILDTAAQAGGVAVFAGDLTDKATGAVWFLNAIMQTIQSSFVSCYAVMGQHDQLYHNNEVSKTQFGTLVTAGVMEILTGGQVINGATLYGRSWGAPYPEPRKNGIGPQILVAHETVTDGTPPPWLLAQSAKQMIEAHPGFDYIVTGDFHEKFVVTHNGCTLINTGPMSRAAVDKKNFKPSCWMISDAGVTEIPIPIEDEVFDLTAVAEASRISGAAFDPALMDKLIFSLEESGKNKPTFDQIVIKGLAVLPPEKELLKNTIQEIMNHVRSQNS